MDAVRGAVKRAIDVVVAAVALVVLSPLFVIIALLVVLDSPGPVLYRAERVGFRGRPLAMLKFRKMHRAARGASLTVAGDERLTRVGAWLARTKLDELPQLWHVLRGEMSLVGPRPESPSFVARFPAEYDVILRVRPGLTGYTQLAFAREASILDPNDAHTPLRQRAAAPEGRARPPLRQSPQHPQGSPDPDCDIHDPRRQAAGCG